MILRVFHGIPRPGGEAALLAGIRTHAAATFQGIPELTGFQLGIRRSEPAEIVIATTWTSFDAILATGGGLLDAPRRIGGAPSYFAAGHADHYELVIGGERRDPIPDARLRVTTATLKPRREGEFFEASRRVAGDLMADGLQEYLLGRRTVADHAEVCAVTVWRDDRVLEGLMGQDRSAVIGAEDLAEYYAAPPMPAHYDPILSADAASDAAPDAAPDAS